MRQSRRETAVTAIARGFSKERVVRPGKDIPFLHRHQQNDEVYVVVGGRGQFLVDGECIDGL